MDEAERLRQLQANTSRNGTTHPTTLSEMFAERSTLPPLALPSVSARLQRKFGLGEAPNKRMKLYKRLEALVEKWDQKVLDLISEAVAEAVGARKPDRYFCRAIVLKLREAGLSIQDADPDAAQW